jgi:hypothetical protein
MVKNKESITVHTVYLLNLENELKIWLLHSLKLQSAVVILRTTCFNIKNLHSSHPVTLCLMWFAQYTMVICLKSTISDIVMEMCIYWDAGIESLCCYVTPMLPKPIHSSFTPVYLSTPNFKHVMLIETWYTCNFSYTDAWTSSNHVSLGISVCILNTSFFTIVSSSFNLGEACNNTNVSSHTVYTLWPHSLHDMSEMTSVSTN